MKENFDEDQESDYLRERRQNKVIQEQLEYKQKTKEDNAKAYNEWIAQKELRDNALKCLALIPKPSLSQKSEEDLARTSLKRFSASKSTQSIDKPLNKVSVDPELSRSIIDIGKALKRVDRTLFSEWASWCSQVFSNKVATAMWDFFPPMACDVHCASYSQVAQSLH